MTSKLTSDQLTSRNHVYQACYSWFFDCPASKAAKAYHKEIKPLRSDEVYLKNFLALWDKQIGYLDKDCRSIEIQNRNGTEAFLSHKFREDDDPVRCYMRIAKFLKKLACGSDSQFGFVNNEQKLANEIAKQEKIAKETQKTSFIESLETQLQTSQTQIIQKNAHIKELTECLNSAHEIIIQLRTELLNADLAAKEKIAEFTAKVDQLEADAKRSEEDAQKNKTDSEVRLAKLEKMFFELNK